MSAQGGEQNRKNKVKIDEEKAEKKSFDDRKSRPSVHLAGQVGTEQLHENRIAEYVVAKNKNKRYDEGNNRRFEVRFVFSECVSFEIFKFVFCDVDFDLILIEHKKSIPQKTIF